MASPATDIQSLLDPLPLDKGVKADAWDAWHATATPEEFRTRFDAMPLPQATKAALWDAKFGAGATPAAPKPKVGTPPPAPPKGWWETQNIPAAALGVVPGGILLEPNAGFYMDPARKMSPQEIAGNVPAALGAVGAGIPGLGAFGGAAVGGATGELIKKAGEATFGSAPPNETGMQAGAGVVGEAAKQGVLGKAGELAGSLVAGPTKTAASWASGLAERVGLPPAVESILQKLALRSVAGGYVAKRGEAAGLQKAGEAAEGLTSELGLPPPGAGQPVGAYVKKSIADAVKGFQAEDAAGAKLAADMTAAQTKAAGEQAKGFAATDKAAADLADELTAAQAKAAADQAKGFSASDKEAQSLAEQLSTAQTKADQEKYQAAIAEHEAQVKGRTKNLAASDKEAASLAEQMSKAETEAAQQRATEAFTKNQAAATAALENATTGVLKQLAGEQMTPQESGLLVQGAIAKSMKAAKGEASALYAASDELNEGAIVDIGNFRDTVEGVADRATNPEQVKLAQDTLRKISALDKGETNQLTFRDARRLQQDLAGDLPRVAGTSADAAQGTAKLLWGELSQSMEDSLSGDGAAALAKANAYYRDFSGTFKRGVVPRLVQTNPERIVQTLLRGGDVTPISALKKAVFQGAAEDPATRVAAEGAWNTVGSAYTRDVLLKGGPAKLLANIDKAGDPVLAQIFSTDTGKASLQDLRQIGIAFKEIAAKEPPVVAPVQFKAQTLAEPPPVGPAPEPPTPTVFRATTLGEPPPLPTPKFSATTVAEPPPVPTAASYAPKPDEGKLAALDRLKELDQVIAARARSGGSLGHVAAMSGLGYLAGRVAGARAVTSTVLPWEGLGALITWSMYHPAQARLLAQGLTQMSAAVGARSNTLPKSLQKVIDEYTAAQAPPMPPPTGAFAQPPPAP